MFQQLFSLIIIIISLYKVEKENDRKKERVKERDRKKERD